MNSFPFQANFGFDNFAVCGTAPAPVLEPSEQSSSSRCVLVLEDDPTQLQILVQHLQSIQLDTVTASTISEAEQRLHDTPVQLAILDVHLPDGSGLELCRRIDDDPRLAGLPVIMLSSSTQNDIVRKTRSSGGCFFIGKPYDPNVLLAMIERSFGECL